MGGIRMYRLTAGASTTTLNLFTGADQEGTEAFMTFVNFGASHLGGGLRLGTEEEESTIRASEMVSVEIRFGPGRSQMAHRFVPPDQSELTSLTTPMPTIYQYPSKSGT